MRAWKFFIHFLLYAILLSGCDVNNDVAEGLSYDEYINLARHYENISENEKAISAYKRALKIKSHDSSTHYELGRLYEAERQRTYSEAIDKLQMEILTNPDTNRIVDQTKRLEKLGYKNQYNELAIQEYKYAIKYNPSNWAARYFCSAPGTLDTR
jgi:tetratricopeptide (TPR) repeat protein